MVKTKINFVMNDYKKGHQIFCLENRKFLWEVEFFSGKSKLKKSKISFPERKSKMSFLGSTTLRFQTRLTPLPAKLMNFPLFPQNFVWLELRFLLPPILTMMHSGIMIYTYWTPLAGVKDRLQTERVCCVWV